MVEKVQRYQLTLWRTTFIKMMFREFRFNTLTTTELPMVKHARYGVLVLGKTTVGIVGQIFSTFFFHILSVV